MKRDNDIVVMGDTHMDFGWVNSFINKRHPKIILQVGDFGYWPKCSTYTEIKTQGTKIYWCDGNHEDFANLKTDKINEIQPNVYYMPRGSTLVLPDGRTVLFIGGAASHDKDWRTPGLDWFPHEIITQKDLDNLPDPNTKIDIVISHTCPLVFNPIANPLYPQDPSQLALELVFDRFRPKQWYFGHYHMYIKGDYCGCHWTCLNLTSAGYHNSNCWCYLIK